jgi:quinol monooxygenase YgiN
VGSLVHHRTLIGLVEFGQRVLALVEYVARVEREDGCIRFGLRRQPREFVPIDSLTGVLGERFELLAL